MFLGHRFQLLCHNVQDRMLMATDLLDKRIRELRRPQSLLNICLKYIKSKKYEIDELKRKLPIELLELVIPQHLFYNKHIGIFSYIGEDILDGQKFIGF